MVRFGLSSSGSRTRNGIDLLLSISKNIIFSSKYPIHYLVESADWAVKTEALTLKKHIPEVNITSSTFGIKHKILHFGTSSLFRERPASENRSILTYYHIAPQDKFKFQVGRSSQFVQKVHTSCEITKNLLVQYGVSENKIVKINIPVDLDIFTNVNDSKKNELRDALNIPDGSIVVGSFQKDGVGWGDGTVPKPEKGPDIFCEVVRELSRKYPIFVLLTGPARGYVKAQLTSFGIPFVHLIADQYTQMPDFYNALDLYLVTSRQEGGPKAVLESMATGTPIISTEVGQAPEVINPGVDGFLAPVEDVESLTKFSSKVIEDARLRKRLIEAGLKTAIRYSASTISRQFYDQVYLPLF
jgi:glycosyltransferase involved in cell wall biosynthesis